eukprot:7091321-Prymnesium_polylepis.1
MATVTPHLATVTPHRWGVTVAISELFGVLLWPFYWLTVSRSLTHKDDTPNKKSARLRSARARVVTFWGARYLGNGFELT